MRAVTDKLYCDVYEREVQVIDIIDACCDSVDGVDGPCEPGVSNRTNEVMKA